VLGRVAKFAVRSVLVVHLPHDDVLPRREFPLATTCSSAGLGGLQSLGTGAFAARRAAIAISGEPMTVGRTQASGLCPFTTRNAVRNDTYEPHIRPTCTCSHPGRCRRRTNHPARAAASVATAITANGHSLAGLRVTRPIALHAKTQQCPDRSVPAAGASRGVSVPTSRPARSAVQQFRQRCAVKGRWCATCQPSTVECSLT